MTIEIVYIVLLLVIISVSVIDYSAAKRIRKIKEEGKKYEYDLKSDKEKKLMKRKEEIEKVMEVRYGGRKLIWKKY